MRNPYFALPEQAFWRTRVAKANPLDIADVWQRKWPLHSHQKIATAGSCFAQHISNGLRSRGINVLDVEPAPTGLPSDIAKKYGYGLYSARYGNIYTVQHLMQLAEEVTGGFSPAEPVWTRDGRLFDSQRPSVEPEGFETPFELIENRKYHLARVKEMLESMDLFIFTLGLTEAFEHIATKTVYPTPPGVIAGDYDPQVYRFKNFTFSENMSAFERFLDVLKSLRGGTLPHIILTVSPVPLTATASGHHVLSANAYSKSVLRAVAGQLSEENSFVDYFPSYEIITHPGARGNHYEGNLRSVRGESVDVVMKHFFGTDGELFEEIASSSGITEEVPPLSRPSRDSEDDGLFCDEAILDGFSRSD